MALALLGAASCSKREEPPLPAPTAPSSAAPAMSTVESPSLPPLVPIRERAQRTQQLVQLPTDDSALEPTKVHTETLDAAALAALRNQAYEPRADRWRFEAFDTDSLYFVLLHRPRFEGTRVQPSVVRRVRVGRSAEAERVLQVDSTLDFYEVGEGDIRGGMGVDQVLQALGEPSASVALGAFGNCDFLYADRTVRFIQNRVASVYGSVVDEQPATQKANSRLCAGRLAH